MATCPDEKFRDPARAIELAKEAVRLTSTDAYFWNTLGVAHYRHKDWQAAIDALTKAEGLAPGKDFAWNAFFLAMAHWQLDPHNAEARKLYDRATAWMERGTGRMMKN